MKIKGTLDQSNPAGGELTPEVNEKKGKDKQHFAKLLKERDHKTKPEFKLFSQELASRTKKKPRDKRAHDQSEASPPQGDASASTTKSQTSSVEVAAPQKPAVDPRIQKLVQEILVGVNQKGNQEVYIQLNSTTLKGLRIHLVKEGEQLHLQFFSKSAEISRLLTKNAHQLTQALTTQGVQVGRLQIQTGIEASFVSIWEYQERSGQGRQQDQEAEPNRDDPEKGDE